VALAGQRRQQADVREIAARHLGAGLADHEVREPRLDRGDHGLGVIAGEQLVAELVDGRPDVRGQLLAAEQLAPLRDAITDQLRPADRLADAAQHLVRIVDRRDAVAVLPLQRDAAGGDRGRIGRPDLAQRRQPEQEAQVRLIELVRRRRAVERQLEVRAELGRIGRVERISELAAVRVALDVEPQELLDEPRERALHRLRGLLDLDLVAGRQPRHRIGIGERHADAGARERLVALPHRLLRGRRRRQAEQAERALAELAEAGRAQERAVLVGAGLLGGHHNHFTSERMAAETRSRSSEGNIWTTSRQTAAISPVLPAFAAAAPRSKCLRVRSSSPSRSASVSR